MQPDDPEVDGVVGDEEAREPDERDHPRPPAAPPAARRPRGAGPDRGAGSPAPASKCGGASSRSIEPPMMGAMVASARRSLRSFTRYRIVSTPPTASSDELTIIELTWTCRQYEVSAGIRGAGAAYTNRTANA